MVDQTHGDRVEALFAALWCLKNEEDFKVLMWHLFKVEGFHRVPPIEHVE